MSKADLTKRALSEAFSELLKEKPFEQITVTEIARKAGLNRQTFYYHFRDLYDLIAFSVKRRIHAILPDIESMQDWELDLVTVLNAPGTIDAGYRGEVCVILANFGQEPFTVEKGMRIAQIVVAPVARAEVVEVEALDATERGAGGFGSTGV